MFVVSKAMLLPHACRDLLAGRGPEADRCLLDDPELKLYIEEYAANPASFLEDYASVHEEVGSLLGKRRTVPGQSWDGQPAAADALSLARSTWFAPTTTDRLFLAWYGTINATDKILQVPYHARPSW